VPNTIFTFWEPSDRLTPYLALCKETWEVHLSAYNVVVLDYANLHEYVDPAVFDLDSLRRFPLPSQKDAVMAAVLKEHGGVFMDMDTIAVGDIGPVVELLERSEVVMFLTHLAFMAARPNARLLGLMYEGIRDKLAAPPAATDSAAEMAWDYLGNSELAKAKRTIVDQSRFLALPPRLIERGNRLAKKGARVEDAWPRPLAVLDWVDRKARAASERLAFATIYRKHLTMLDGDKFGFIAEARGWAAGSFDPERAYVDFWFERDLSPDDVFRDDQMLIALHNSWTPAWYRDLDREGVLSHDCLLSKTLRRVLQR
jgi:Glycosyltransferase sugar-binding region containing DXD motif